MIWNILSALFCGLLVVRLVLFTDEHREQSKLVYRVLLYVITLYAAHIVIAAFYSPTAETNPLLTLFHLSLLVAALAMKVEYLPGNLKNDSPTQDPRLVGHSARRIR